MRSSVKCCLLLLSLYSHQVNAQTPVALLHFENLSREEGLSGYVITALRKDDDGFLWIGTQRGLDRYSGVRMRVFNRNPDSPSWLLDDDINALEKDDHKKGGLWIGTDHGGLSRYDPEAEKFKNFLPDSSTLSSARILTLFNDRRGVLWVGTDAGMNRFDHYNQSFRVFRNDPLQSHTLAGDSVGVIFEAPTIPGKLWVGTSRGLSILDVSRDTFDAGIDRRSRPSGVTITAITEVMGSIWLGTYAGLLYRYAPHEDRFEQIEYLPHGVSSMPISALAASNHSPSLLWVGTEGQGLFAFDTKTSVAQQYSSKMSEGSLSGSYVMTVLEDTMGTLWVGTRTGLNKATLEKPFEPFLVPTDITRESAEVAFTISHDVSRSSNGQSVPTIYSPPSRSNVVWLSLKNEGIWRYDRISREFQPAFAFADQIGIILAIHEDHSGKVWIGGIHRNIFSFDSLTMEVQLYPLSTDGDVVVHQIYEMASQPEILWIATRDHGLFKFDSRKRALVGRYSDDSSSIARLSSNYVWSVHEPSEEQGVLLLATRYGGLNRLDTRTNAVTVFKKSDGCLSSNDIIAVASTGEGQIWLGTYGAGLIKFDLRTNTCKSFSLKEGLPDTDVSAIFVDGQNRLWLSTSNGLSVFSPDSESLTNFTQDDGLQSNIFHYRAHHQNANGEILLGGSKGFNIFHPDSILGKPGGPKVLITNLLVDGKPYSFVPKPKAYESISLSFLENDLTFEFAALDLRQPVKNRYKVMLEGAEDEWREIGNQAYERYPFLPSGSYTFHVIGANSDGYWNKEGASLSFTINPPFWKAWWFWTLMAVSGFGLVIGAYQYRIHQLKRLERTRKRIADDLHDDIGSKMSSIALMVDVTGHNLELEDEQKGEMSDISATAREVVDDLRDAVWIVDAGHDDLTALVRRMKQVAAQILKGQAFQFRQPEAIPSVRLKMEHRRHLFLLYKEMLHNVMRHAKASHVEIETRYANSQFTLQVRDDGVGFDPSNVRHGRGLTTLQTRATALHGNLQIDSKPGEGTIQRLTVRMA